MVDRLERTDEDSMEHEEELDTTEVITLLRKHNTKIMAIVFIITLCMMFFYLGFIQGFNQAFTGQKNYYEHKIDTYCFCRDEPNYDIMNRSVVLPDILKNKKK